VLDDLLAGDRPTARHGDLRVVALLGVDIRGFTSLVAESPPADVIRFVNLWFGRLTEIVERHHGMVNQLLGDGLFAVFGAPLSTLDNDANAVRAALDIARFVARSNSERPPGWPGRDIHVGIAVHRGTCAVGSVGSDAKLEYAVVGEPVYRLHEIEELAREWIDTVLVSSEVRAWTSDRFYYVGANSDVWRLSADPA
jgi:class 3 adenylate cyclase